MGARRSVGWIAILLITALGAFGCAKDSGGSSTGGTTSASDCKRNASPSGGAAAGASSSAAAAPIDGSALRVGMAYDVGGRGDASFNDAAGAGLDKAKADFKIAETKELTAATGESEDARLTRLRQLVAGGYNPIVAVGFVYQSALKTVAAEAPNVKFAIVDSGVDGAANVTGLTFAEEQGSYLVGVAAGLKTKACHVGFIGGVEVPLIQKFQAGYVQGVKAVAPDAKIEVKYLTPAGDFSGFNDPAKGTEAAKAQLDAGADVIYAAAGTSGIGAISAIKAANTADKPKWAIGVDSDQYNQPKLAASKDVILTSMLKRVDVAVYDFVGATASNNLASLPKVFDLKVDGVGYATSGGFVDDIKDQLEAYKAKIVDGSITVPTKP